MYANFELEQSMRDEYDTGQLVISVLFVRSGPFDALAVLVRQWKNKNGLSVCDFWLQFLQCIDTVVWVTEMYVNCRSSV